MRLMPLPPLPPPTFFPSQTTSRGLSLNYRNLTLRGVTDLRLCGRVGRAMGGRRTWKARLCLPSLLATVDTNTGPGVPFKGRVTAVLSTPKLAVTFRDVDGRVHFRSARLRPTAKARYIPTYDSSIPLNPWSKVSMSGYMVSR